MVDDNEIVSVQRLLVVLGRMGELLTSSIASTLPEGLTGNGPVATLLKLHIDGPSRPGVIIDVTGLSSSGVTRLLDRLEDAGLVLRRYGSVDADRRGTVVELTPTGRQACGEMASSVLQVLPDVRVLLKEIADIDSAT